MTAAATAQARLAVATLLALGAGTACRRKSPSHAPLPEPAAAATRPAADAAGDQEPLLTEQKLSPELRKLVDAAHAHSAVGSLEAAGCDQAFVMTGAAYNRLADLRYGKKMPAQVEDPRADVVWCDRRTPDGPDCTDVAPIFARVARPRRPFEVFSAYGAPPFSPRCWGRHDRTGKVLAGEGPGYPSSRGARVE